MKFLVKFLIFLGFLFLNSSIYAQDSNVVYYSLFLEKSVSFGTIDTKIDEGSFKEGQSFTIPTAELPSSPIDFSIYQDLYNTLIGGKFEIEYGALNKDILMKIFIRSLKSNEGTYLNLGKDQDTLFSYFEIRIWELPDSNFFPEDSSYYFNDGYYAKFSLPKSDNLMKFLNITGLGTEDSLGFAFLENNATSATEVEDWSSDGIESFETADSIIFKSIHLSRIGGGRKKKIVAKTELTDIKVIDQKGVSQSYKLYQNYPNPFNPTTTIRYSIPQQFVENKNFHSVRLIVYDVLGREVRTLVNENQKAGNYKVQWNASEVPSGIYFYSIQTKDFRFTRKMVLLK